MAVVILLQRLESLNVPSEMDLLDIYTHHVPDFIREISMTAPMERLRQVGMNCGCEYSSTALFRRIGPYSRYEHSMGAGLIVWNFTHDTRQAISALLHDIATPCFAHVIDFLHGDYERQESTEDRTLDMIKSSSQLVRILGRLSLSPEDVSDYHLFPVADNDAPRLSSDRLEYTLGNGINYGFMTKEEARVLYSDIERGINDEGVEELMFRNPKKALRFAQVALKCSKIYSGDEDRYLMQRLAELVRDCIAKGLFFEDDLYTTEPAIISRMLTDAQCAAAWKHFCGIQGVMTGVDGPAARIVHAKKRYVDPFVPGMGRVTQWDEMFRNELREYLDFSFDYTISEC